MVDQTKLDQILTGISTIGAQVNNIREAQIRTEGKVDTLTERTIITEQSLKSAHNRIGELSENVNDNIDNNIQPVLEDYKKNKNRLIGIVMAAFGLGSGTGSIATWLAQMTGGGN